MRSSLARVWYRHASVLLVAWFSVAIPSCSKGKKRGPKTQDDPDTVSLSREALANIELETSEAKARVLRPKLSIQGDVSVPKDKIVKVVARVGGVVRAVHKKPGDSVAKDELLAVIESRELAEHVLKYVETSKKASFTRSALHRERKLWEKGISPKNSYLKKKEEASAASLALSSAIQRLKLLGLTPRDAGALMSRKRSALSLYELRSPLAGTVIQRKVVVGQAVDSSTELLEVADLSLAAVQVKVPSKHLSFMDVGSEVRVKALKVPLDARGKITFIAPTVDPHNRTVLVTAVVPNTDGKWRPGLCALVIVSGKPVEVAVSVARKAVVEIDGRSALFVKTGASSFRRRQVEVGREDEEHIEIKRGVSVGEEVVSKNVMELFSAWNNRSR